MAKINKIQVKSVDYEIEDLQAIHGTLKTINNETLLGDGNVETIGRKTEEGGEIFNNSTVAGSNSHAEGADTSASGSNAHSEGAATVASGNGSHAEGYMSKAAGNNSHAEGYETSALNEQSHAEGLQTTSSGLNAHAEGYQTTASGNFAHSEGQNSEASGQSSHVEGCDTRAESSYSHAEGNNTTARGEQSHAEGASSNKAPEGTDIEALKTSWETNKFSIALGTNSHVEGLNNISGANASHAEGEINYVSGIASHAEGYSNIVTGSYGAHAEGQSNKVSGQASHAEGCDNEVTGTYSHAEGNGNVASGAYSHVEGRGTQALNSVEHAEGKWNKSNINTISSIGIGTDNKNRRNAFEVSDTGKVYILNIGNYDGTNSDSASSVNEIITNLPDFDTFVTESELTAKDYATKSEIPDVSNLASKDDIPTKVSELENDSNFLTSIPDNYVTDTELQEAISGVQFELPVATDSVLGGIKVGAGLNITEDGILSATGGGTADSVNWENVIGRPTSLSQFTNDSGFITNDDLPDLSNYALKSEIPIVPTNVSSFTNDAGYITNSALSNYATKSELLNYAPAEHTHIVANITDFPEIPDVSNLATKDEVNAKQDALISGTNIKTINGTSLLGSGNLVIEAGGGSEIMDVLDNKTYARTQGSWVDLTDWLTWAEYD